jgi:hypothetical protein
MKKLLALAAAAEAATGLFLIAAPSLAARLLLNAEVSGAGLAFGRVCGIGLVSLGAACFPSAAPARAAALAMLLYNSLSALYLAILGAGGESAGPLLWPVVLFHAVMTILLARAWLQERSSEMK